MYSFSVRTNAMAFSSGLHVLWLHLFLVVFWKNHHLDLVARIPVLMLLDKRQAKIVSLCIVGTPKRVL